MGKLKLLRAIKVPESTHNINKWSVTFNLTKAYSEPCWKRLLRTMTTYTWLKKDHDRIYTEECQRAKEAWREAYFTAKNKGKDPSTKNDKWRKDLDNAASKGDEDRNQQVDEWKKTLEE